MACEMDEWARIVGPAQTAMLAAEARAEAEAENRHPGVDQGGMYDWADPDYIFRTKLRKAAGRG